MIILLPKLKEMVEEKFGEFILYSFQCYALQKSIQEATGDLLSVSTLKRIFGFAASNHLPRLSTLDILASYVGYPNFGVLEKDTNEGLTTSEFVQVEAVAAESISHGSIVRLIYAPGRSLTLKYEGDEWFEVKKVSGGKLRIGDMLRIGQIVLNFQLIVSDVKRGGISLGSYIAAKQGGIKSINIK